MYILGLSTHVTCGSALLKDGKIIAALNDERLVRKKMVFGFPRESIRKILEMTDVSPDEIDYIAVATKRQHLVDEYVDYLGGKFKFKRGIAKQIFFDVGSQLSKYVNRLPFFEKIYYILRQPFFVYRRYKVRQILKEEFGFVCPVKFIDHHYCHAASAYYSSGFEDATVITLDSAGDGVSSKVYKVSNNEFEELSKVSSFNSVGAFYSYATEICGFQAGKHEGKLTGLAAYGEPKYRDIFEKLIIYDNKEFKNIGGVFFKSALKEIRGALPKNFKREDLAATIQQYLEEKSVDYVRDWLAVTKKPNIALAGGVFANVRINQKIHEIPGVKGIFIHPAMSDEGIGLGAALVLYYEKCGSRANVIQCMDHVYLGPAYSDEEIMKELEKEGTHYEYHQDIEKVIAGLLAKGHVVARFNGPMEYGPRALGNRSILYQPTDPSVNDWLNERLNRTEFMPFAPATLAEDVDSCFLGIDGAKNAARFMTITFDCTDWMKENCLGVVHIDGTARPQLVSKEDNPSFHRVINEYKKITGIGAVINTSFNIHEEPIVCDPANAIKAFREGHLDYLAMGSYLIKADDGNPPINNGSHQ